LRKACPAPYHGGGEKVEAAWHEERAGVPVRTGRGLRRVRCPAIYHEILPMHKLRGTVPRKPSLRVLRAQNIRIPLAISFTILATAKRKHRRLVSAVFSRCLLFVTGAECRSHFLYLPMSQTIFGSFSFPVIPDDSQHFFCISLRISLRKPKFHCCLHSKLD